MPKRLFGTYRNCFICREWGYNRQPVRGVHLCYPCWADVLEVRFDLAGGVMGAETRITSSARERVHPTPESDESPGNSPSPFLDLFE